MVGGAADSTVPLEEIENQQRELQLPSASGRAEVPAEEIVMHPQHDPATAHGGGRFLGNKPFHITALKNGLREASALSLQSAAVSSAQGQNEALLQSELEQLRQLQPAAKYVADRVQALHAKLHAQQQPQQQQPLQRLVESESAPAEPELLSAPPTASSGWVERVNGRGQSYFFNPNTGDRRWVAPNEFDIAGRGDRGRDEPMVSVASS